tara:strand:- start:719 stop:934 length:216 start_codon:yes stop_codon:yes gene_type:complete
MADMKKTTAVPKLAKSKAKAKPKAVVMPAALRGTTLTRGVYKRKAAIFLCQEGVSAADRKYLEQRLQRSRS